MKFLNKLIFGGLLFAVAIAKGQTVYLVDANTSEPITGATILNPDDNAFETSDVYGAFQLDKFQKGSALKISHLSYESSETSWNEAMKQRVLYLIPNTQQLQEIVLSVARTKENKDRLAKKVGVITKQEMERWAPTNSAQALLSTGGVRLQQSQGGGGSPVLRGFEANRVLLVVDGVRLNNAIYRTGHLQNALTIDPNSLERTEVIFGPASVGYGSDALGGVVHYYTHSPTINNKKKWSQGFSTAYHFGQGTNIHHFQTEYSQSSWASFTSVSLTNVADIRMGKNRVHGFEDWGLVTAFSNNSDTFFKDIPQQNSNPNLQKNSGYAQVDVLQKFGFQINSSSRLNLNLQFSKSSDIPRFDKLVERRQGNLRFAQWYYGPQKRLLVSPQYKFSSNKWWVSKGTITAAFQQIEESRNQRKFGSLSLQSQIENVSVYSLNADLFLPISSSEKTLSYGFELTHNDVNSKAFTQDLVVKESAVQTFENKQLAPTRYPSDGSQYSTAAFYADYRHNINAKSTLNTGIRYTYTRLNAAWKEKALIDANLSSVKSQNSSITATAGYVFRPNNRWQINSILASGFRSPNIDDIGKIRENGGDLSVPNPKVKPEYAYNAELGLIYFSKNRKSSLSLNGYYTWLRNFIGRASYSIDNDLSTANPNTIIYAGEEVFTIANVNLGNANIYGGTFDWKSQLNKQFSFTGNLTITKGFALDSTYPLPSISPFFGQATIDWKKQQWEALLLFQFSEKKSPEDYSFGGEDGLEETPLVQPNAMKNTERYAGTPAWKTVTASVRYSPNTSWNILCRLENITDLHYRTFASGISAPGRTLILRVAYAF